MKTRNVSHQCRQGSAYPESPSSSLTAHHSPLTAHSSQRGSITLVALCFVTVMAIGLASYLAVSNQSMKLSNRTYAKDVSRQLAEKGLEMALLGLQTNNWSSTGTGGTWTISGTTATATLSAVANSYGTSGFTATTKIRVDNYGAYNQPSTWNATTNYQLNDVVGYTNPSNSSGMWYRCIVANTNQTPTETGPFTYWVPAPIPWTWGPNITYSPYEVVNYLGTWYRCIVAPTSNQDPTNTSYWAPIPSLSLAWLSNTTYNFGAMLYDSGIWYYCIKSHTSSVSIGPTNATYWAPVVTETGIDATPTASTYNNGDAYALGNLIYRKNDQWYRCIASQPYTFSGSDYSDTTKWTPSTPPYISWAYRSTATYVFNDVVYFPNASNVGTWYRCIANGSPNGYPYNSAGSTGLTPGSTPPSPSTACWENALSTTWTWSSGDTYEPGDIIYRSTSFYRCVLAHSNKNPTSNASYWSTDPLFSPAWDPGKQYSIDDSALDTGNDLVFYNGHWYLYISSTPAAGKTPSDEKDHWAVAPRSISAWDSAKSYSTDDLVSSGSNWYRCLINHSNQALTNTTYWQPMTGATYAWNASTTYAAGNYVNYGGAWYKCILAPTANQSPNDSTYWSSAWVNSYGVTLGTPVIYAEGAVTMTDGAVIKTQLRATASPASLFPNAVGASNTITLNGGGTIDSYDGSVTSLGTGGLYTAKSYNAATSTYAATLASNYTSGTAINGGTGTIQGYLTAPSSSTPPYAPLSSFNGTLKGTSTGTGTGLDLTRLSRSPFIPLFDIFSPIPQTSLPSRSYTTLNLGTPGSPVPIYTNDANLLIGTTININGPVILRLTGYLNIASGKVVNINGPGSLIVNMTSTSSGRLMVDAAGNGFNNRTKDPRRLVIISSVTGTGTQYYNDTDNPFYGVIYLPYTTRSDGLNIANGVQIYGAVSAKTVTFAGAANLHYDTSLRYATIPGINTPFQLDRWRELTDTSERAVLP